MDPPVTETRLYAAASSSPHLPWRLCNVHKMPLGLVLNRDRRSPITPALHAAVALAAHQVPHHLQDRDVDAPHSTRSMSVVHVSRRPGCIQHGKLSTTSTQVVPNQSFSRETDTEPIRQTHLLSLWSHYIERSSSSSPQH